MELRDWAFEEERRLSEAGYWEGAEWPGRQWLENRKCWLKERDDAVTAALDHYLETGVWGDLARDERAALHYRLSWATQILALLTMPSRVDEVIVPQPAVSRAAVLRWVLVDTWEVFGRTTARRLLLRQSKLP